MAAGPRRHSPAGRARPGEIAAADLLRASPSATATTPSSHPARAAERKPVSSHRLFRNPDSPTPWRTSLSPVSMTGKCGRGCRAGDATAGMTEKAPNAAIWHRTGRPFTSKGTARFGMVHCLRFGSKRREHPLHGAAESPLIHLASGVSRLQNDVPAVSRSGSRSRRAPRPSLPLRPGRRLGLRSTQA